MHTILKDKIISAVCIFSVTGGKRYFAKVLDRINRSGENLVRINKIFLTLITTQAFGSFWISLN